MHNFVFKSIVDAWDTLVPYIVEHGHPVSPRKLDTIEINNVSITYPKPTQYVFYNPVRHLNPVFHLVELFYFLNGREDDLLCRYVHQMENFIDKDINRFDGSYGPPLYFGLARALKYLQLDRDTRRAVIPILQEKHLMNTETKDMPCNDLIGLMIRDNKLHLTVVNRSQDLMRGGLYDTLEFQLLQYMLAKALKLEVGSYNYYSFSLHLYKSDIELCLKSVGKTEINEKAPDFTFQDVDAFWQYCRKMNIVIEDPEVLSLADDASLAIYHYVKRKKPNHIEGIYTDWVNKWLTDTEKRKRR